MRSSIYQCLPVYSPSSCFVQSLLLLPFFFLSCTALPSVLAEFKCASWLVLFSLHTYWQSQLTPAEVSPGCAPWTSAEHQIRAPEMPFSSVSLFICLWKCCSFVCYVTMITVSHIFPFISHKYISDCAYCVFLFIVLLCVTTYPGSWPNDYLL